MTKIKKLIYDLKSINYYPIRDKKQLYYSLAVTGKGKCCFCRKEIPKRTPTLWYWDKFKKYPKINPTGITGITSIRGVPINLNIKKKICFRCIENDILNNNLRYCQEEIRKIQQLRKSFRRTLKGKKCKRTIENSMVLEELQREDFSNNVLN